MRATVETSPSNFVGLKRETLPKSFNVVACLRLNSKSES